jgi:hypothetical protein
MRRIKKIMAGILILSLTAGVFAQERQQQHFQQPDKKSATECRRKLAGAFILTGGLSALAGSTVLHGCGAHYGIWSPKTIKVSKYLFRCGSVVMAIGFFLMPNKANAAELPRTAEHNMNLLYRNPFLLLDEKRFTDYDLYRIESKYPEELIKYMDRFQTFLVFFKKENKKNWDSVNWDKIKEQAYLKAGSPRFMKDEYTDMSHQDIISDEFFYAEFLSCGYWPQFLDAFNEYVENKALLKKKAADELIKGIKSSLQPDNINMFMQTISDKMGDTTGLVL